jgi:hypothetical protein
MMKASGGRGKIMARNFAFNFLVPLMLEVVRLGIIYKDKRVIEVAGAPLQIDAEAWTERTTCTVSQHLGYGEKDMAANELAMGYKEMAGDPGLGGMFGQKQRFEMLHDIAKLKGFNRFAAYLDPNAPPPGPDPTQGSRSWTSRRRQVDASMVLSDVKQAARQQPLRCDPVQAGAECCQDLHLDALNTRPHQRPPGRRDRCPHPTG